jgi:OmpA-OmpF porin, OOP family
MNKNFRKLTGIAAAVAALALSAAAQAQSSTTTTTSSSGDMMSGWSGTSWYPTGNRYIGLNAGSGDIGGNCILDCEGNSDVYSLYTGGMWNKNFGMEVGATDFRAFNRGLGTASAYGFSIKAVGVLPITQSFSAFAKAGTIYGRTKGALDGSNPGARDSDWGSSYGVGVSFDVTPSLAAVLEYDQSNLRFAGNREHINTTSVGLKYRF